VDRGSHLAVRRAAFAFPSVAALVLFAPAARADLTSWASAGGGYSLAYNGGVAAAPSRMAITPHYDWAGMFSGTFGVGSTPLAPIVLGGVVRETTRFGLGTDIGIMARATTGGFSRGDWGVALDLGASMRWWGYGEYGRYPLQGVLTAGAPWGIQIAVGADIVNLDGQPPTRGGFALLEIDVLRLTLMRQGSTDKAWKNPSPAGGRIEP
jgi:hypothetical protein